MDCRITFESHSNVLAYCEELLISFDNLSTFDESVQWYWTYEDSIFSNSMIPDDITVYNYCNLNEEKICLIGEDSTGCIDKNCIYAVDLLMSSNHLSISEHVLVLSPNPTKNWLNINYNKNTSENVNVSFFTIDGRLIKSINFNYWIKDKSEIIDTSFLKEGIYLVVFSSQNLKLTSKLVKIN